MTVEIFMFMKIPLSLIIKDYAGCSMPIKCEKKIFLDQFPKKI